MRRGLILSLLGIIGVAVVALGVTIGVGHKPLLGLDLEGGVSVVLQPQGTVDSGTLQQAVSIIDQRVNGLGVANSSVQRQGKDVVISLPGIKDPQRALSILGSTAQLFFRPVYCEIAPAAKPSTSTTKGGATTTTTPRKSARPTPTTPATTRPVSPATTKASAGTAPGTATATAAVSEAGAGATEATLTAVHRAGPTTTTPSSRPTTPASPAATTPRTSPATTAPATPTTTLPPSVAAAQAACSSANSSTIATTPINQVTAANAVIVPDRTNSVRYVLGPADNTDGKTPPKGVNWVKTAAAEPPGQNGPAWSVVVTFNGVGNTGFNAVAAQRYPSFQSGQCPTSNTSCLEAIELDGVVESAPQIESSTFAGSASITGSTGNEFTSSSANALAIELRYGSLPVRFTPQQIQTVSATVGRDSLHAGLIAGIAGLAVVLLYMIFYYRALGLVVLVGLGVGGALLYSIITALSQSANLALTLSGVTGIIVSIGITVDSYVVYFERLKDEVRGGRTVRQSVERGFTRAFRTVLTADFVTLLAAVVLYLLTVGDVRGFAFMLGLSTLLDIFTAFFFIRPAVILLGRRRTFTEARFLGIARGLGSSRATT